MQTLRHKNELSEVEKTFLMPEYDLIQGTLDDYAETAIQYGYTTMFVAAFPLATLMSLVNNYVELRVDAWKLCHILRRPEPRGCEDIGTWAVILEIVSIAAIFINSALVAFTGTHTIQYTYVLRIWIFILMATGLFCIRWLIEYSIPEVPLEIDIQLKRQEFIVGKLLDNIEDDHDVDISHVGTIPTFDVNNTDLDPM